MLATEMPLLFQNNNTYSWVDRRSKFVYNGDSKIVEGLPERLDWDYINSWSPEKAEELFLQAYYTIKNLEAVERGDIDAAKEYEKMIG